VATILPDKKNIARNAGNRNSSGQGGYTGNEEGNPLIKLPEIPSGENLANRYLIK
jgi:hypothetical protein